MLFYNKVSEINDWLLQENWEFSVFGQIWAIRAGCTEHDTFQADSTF